MNAMSRETTMKNYLNQIKDRYDFVVIDCMPSLSMVTLNALSAADSVIIPVQAQYLPAKGMTQLVQTISRVIKYYPQRITSLENRIAGLEKDVETAKQHPKPMDDRFVGMEVQGAFYSEKADAGKAIIDACKQMTSPEAIPLGKYRGFDLELYFDSGKRTYCVTVKGENSRSLRTISMPWI